MDKVRFGLYCNTNTSEQGEGCRVWWVDLNQCELKRKGLKNREVRFIAIWVDKVMVDK